MIEKDRRERESEREKEIERERERGREREREREGERERETFSSIASLHKKVHLSCCDRQFKVSNVNL